MSQTETEICNSALLKIGGARIISLEDDSREARICKEQYPKIRDELLRAHPWNFSLKRAQLAKLTSTPLFEYESMFQLPSDCMFVQKTNMVSEQEWKVEGDKLLANIDTIKILYRAKVTDVNQFDENFKEVLAIKLAHDICYSLVQSLPLKQTLAEELKMALAHARSLDAQEGFSDRTVDANEWIYSRY